MIHLSPLVSSIKSTITSAKAINPTAIQVQFFINYINFKLVKRYSYFAGILDL